MKTNKKIVTLTAAVASTVAMSSCATQSEKSEKMNVLFIPIDDMRAELGCYGSEDVISPNIDALAASGTLFNRAYVQSAVSNPSRASLLTGQRPDVTKVWDLFTDFRDALPNTVTLPQYFKENGYHTIGYGKTFHNTIPDTISWTTKYLVDGWPFDPDAVYVNEDNKKEIQERIDKFIAAGVDKRDQVGKWYVKTKSTEIADVPDNAYYDGLQTDEAIKRIEEMAKSGENFFLSVGYYRPHLPFNAPKKYWDMYDRDKIKISDIPTPPEGCTEFSMNDNYEIRGYSDMGHTPMSNGKPLNIEDQKRLKHGYYASVTYTDAQIGRLVQSLKDNGLYDNTIIVLWSDHGWKLGEYNSWSKMTNYEIDCKSPLIVVDPRLEKKGVVQPKIVEFVDIYPTVCDLAGLPIPEGLAGESLKNDMQVVKTEESYGFSQFLRGRYGAGPRKLGIETMGYAVRSNNFRYVEWYSWDKATDTPIKLLGTELYDHTTDPKETKNVVNNEKYSDVIKVHKAQIAKNYKLKNVQ